MFIVRRLPMKVVIALVVTLAASCILGWLFAPYVN